MKIIKLLIILIPLRIKLQFIQNKDFIIRYQSIKKMCNDMIKFAGYKFSVKGLENIANLKGVVFVSNHQGLIDPVPLVASNPIPFSFISKKENEKLPIFGFGAKLLDIIHFDRNSREGNIYMLRESIRRIKKGKSILIFPEGTRSKSNKMNNFKEGAFQVAYSSKATIVPITLNGAYDINNDCFSVIFHKPIEFNEYKDLNLDEISDNVYHIINDSLS